LKFILLRIKPHLCAFLFGIFFLSLEALADLTLPLIMSYVVDLGIGSKDAALILSYGLLMLAVALSGAFCAFMRNRLAAYVSENVARELRTDLYAKVQHFSFENRDRISEGELITRLTNDVTQIKGFVYGSMRILIKAPLTSIGAMAFIIMRTPSFIPVLAAIILFSALWVVLNILAGFPRYRNLQEKLDILNSAVREYLIGVRTVKAFSAEEKEKAQFERSSSVLASANVKALRVAAVLMPLVNLTVNLGIVVILVMANTGLNGRVGALMASVNYMTQILFSLSMVSNIVNRSVRASASAIRIREVLEEENEQKVAEGGFKGNGKGELEFSAVSFSYASSSKNTLSDISFTVVGGSSLAIIGPTGSGKSTLINLIPRFYDVNGGAISLDGVDVKDWDMERLRSAIRIVTQRPMLFSGTIRENLAFASDTAGEDEMLNALEKASALAFVNSADKGMDTLLGQRGVTLSGGQKQRLSIARALLGKAELMILDDATSALDSFTEARVLDNLLASQSSVILVTQRISTARRADKILVLEEGRAVGFGSHEVLLETCPVYKDLCLSQMGGD
jgi:ABC-type multidrug transport system, ATPase and permease components